MIHLRTAHASLRLVLLLCATTLNVQASKAPFKPQVLKIPDVWYAPRFQFNGATPADLFPLLTTPEQSWPSLANRTSTFKLFLDMLYVKGAPGLPPGLGTTDDELRSLISTLARRGMRVGLEFGGARWGRGRCNATTALQYAAIERT